MFVLLTCGVLGFDFFHKCKMEKDNFQLILKYSSYLIIGIFIGKYYEKYFSSSSSSSRTKNNSIKELQTNKSLKIRIEKENSNLLIPLKNLLETSSDVLGPFYVIGAPFRSKLSPINSIGRKLLIKGTLRNLNGNFIPFTVIDFWQV